MQTVSACVGQASPRAACEESAPASGDLGAGIARDRSPSLASTMLVSSGEEAESPERHLDGSRQRVANEAGHLQAESPERHLNERLQRVAGAGDEAGHLQDDAMDPSGSGIRSASQIVHSSPCEASPRVAPSPPPAVEPLSPRSSSCSGLLERLRLRQSMRNSMGPSLERIEGAIGCDNDHATGAAPPSSRSCLRPDTWTGDGHHEEDGTSGNHHACKGQGGDECHRDMGDGAICSEESPKSPAPWGSPPALSRRASLASDHRALQVRCAGQEAAAEGGHAKRLYPELLGEDALQAWMVFFGLKPSASREFMVRRLRDIEDYICGPEDPTTSVSPSLDSLAVAPPAAPKSAPASHAQCAVGQASVVSAGRGRGRRRKRSASPKVSVGRGGGLSCTISKPNEDDDSEAPNARRTVRRAAEQDELLAEAIRADKDLYERLLLFEPVELGELRERLETVRPELRSLGEGRLRRFLDDQGLLFASTWSQQDRMASRRGRRHR